MSEEAEALDEDEVLFSLEEDSSAFKEKIAILKARCLAAGIEFEDGEDSEGDRYAEISFPAGKNKRKVMVYSESRADALLAVDFEKYRFIASYEAICSYQAKYLEVGLRTTRMAPPNLMRRLQNKPFGSEAEGDFQIVPPDNLMDRPVLEIGEASPEFQALSRFSSRITLKMKGIKSTQNDQALAEMRAYADSLFFQIDLLYGSTFILERQRQNRLLQLNRKSPKDGLAYPVAHYNDEAMSLFWYAKTARDMPLLRFLAFYQSIEFYFPRYSQSEARKRVSAILKNPAFRAHRDDDLDRLVSAIQSVRGGGLASERSQLRSAVTECISAEDMRAYLTGSKDREEHFSGKSQKAKYHKIPVLNKTADLRMDAADRIYDIRCKIVHTKNEHSEDEFPMILPFSEDADYLSHDIDLVEFVAKSVLISSSGQLT